MSYDDFIIVVYLLVETLYQNIVTKPLRSKGFLPALSDTEIITMELVGESLGFDTDKEIWAYFKNCYQHYFPKLGSYPNFAKHCANLVWVKDKMMKVLGSLCILDNQDSRPTKPYLIDSFPLLVCVYQRAKRHKSFKGVGSFGYCASKSEHYFGFKAHLLTNQDGQVIAYTLTPANTDDRQVVFELTQSLQGGQASLVFGDKGYLSKALQEELAKLGVDLQTPLRDNMKEDRGQGFVSYLKRTRKTIETVISQLSQRFNVQTTKARDLWHLSNRFIRKLLAHSLCVQINKQLGNPPLRFEMILS